MLDVLVLAPHPDDAEIGMGGSIALMLAEGLRVGILDLTDGEPTPLGSREARQRETEAASRVLGVAWRRRGRGVHLPKTARTAHAAEPLESRWQVAIACRACVRVTDSAGRDSVAT